MLLLLLLLCFCWQGLSQSILDCIQLNADMLLPLMQHLARSEPINCELQEAECSHAAADASAGVSDRPAQEVEKRNAPAGTSTTPELANDATGDLSHCTCTKCWGSDHLLQDHCDGL